MKLFNQFNIIMLTLSFAIIGCSNNNNKNISNTEKDTLVVSDKKVNYTLNDLISFSKEKYGFVKNDGTINEYYGDFDFVTEENIFHFNVGCGSQGDIISVIFMTNDSKRNSFDLFIPKGDNYYGKPADSNKKVGEFELISDNEIHGKIKLCLEEGSGCCGEEGESFILKKTSTTSETAPTQKKGFTIKKNKDLPSWFDNVNRTYMLNDDRILESDQIEYIGGYVPNKGEIFFINNSEIVFPENQIKINKTKSKVTKTLTSGEYTIKINWDTDLTTGEYSEGKINLYKNNLSIFNSPLIISGW
jgi:hypothetical protein